MKIKKNLAPWATTRTSTGPDIKVFKVRYDWVINPRNGQKLQRTVLQSTDWVNVVALNSEQQLIMVRQYRFGIQKVTTEIPGGLIDPGEDSKTAASRELREETGYTSEDWQYLGAVEPNPAVQNNLCHHWLARNVKKTHLPAPDDGEDIAMVILSEDALRQEILEGRLRHSLALSALSRVFDLREVLQQTLSKRIV